jgi:hypothetical protein
MTILPLTILLAGVGTVSVIVDRRLQARKRAAATISGTAEPAAQAENTTSNGKVSWWRGVTNWSPNFIRKQPADLPQQFRTWANNATDDAVVKEWLNGLDDEGIQAFTKHLQGFCTDMGFELSWIVTRQLESDPALAQTTRDIVLHYCRACQQAASAQDDFELHKKLEAFEQNPTSKKHQEFAEKLFAKVAEAGLVAGSISDYFGASPKERSRLMVEAIHKAAATNREAFNRAVRETLRGDETARTAASQAQQPATSTAA